MFYCSNSRGQTIFLGSSFVLHSKGITLHSAYAQRIKHNLDFHFSQVKGLSTSVAIFVNDGSSMLFSYIGMCKALLLSFWWE